jgi:GNAT superfamily N-acetyltransferase
MFEIKQESFIKNRPHLEILFEFHYKEVSRHFKQNIPLDPDWERYEEFENNNALVFLALRFNGYLVGYFNGVVNRSLHYKRCTQLTTDLIYVHRPFRGRMLDNRTGADLLIEKAKEIAKMRECSAFDCNFKFARSTHMKRLLERHDFEPFDAHYICWL